MAGGKVRSEGLAALSVAAAELLGDHHDEFVTIVADDSVLQRERMLRLRKLGKDLVARGDAGLVLIDYCQVD